MTLPELWAATGDLPPGVDPWEIQAELAGRLARILSLPVLPLMAIPLAIGRVRSQRSYGLVVGLAVLIAFHQILQLGEALADNNKVPVWLGLWVPFVVFALGSAIAVRSRRDARARSTAVVLARPPADAARPPAAAARGLWRQPADERR